jgi:hypothetical protein
MKVPLYFLDGLKNIKVGRLRNQLCYNLFDSIRYIQDLLKKNGRICEGDLEDLVRNLKGNGYPFVCEYFTHVKIDRLKPDLYVKRIMSHYFCGVDETKQFDDKGTLEWARGLQTPNAKYKLTQIDFCSGHIVLQKKEIFVQKLEIVPAAH